MKAGCFAGPMALGIVLAAPALYGVTTHWLGLGSTKVRTEESLSRHSACFRHYSLIQPHFPA